MEQLTNKISFGGDILNCITKRKLHPSGMVYKDGGWTIKIPKIFPLLNGVIVLIYQDHTRIIEIWKYSGLGKWFGNELLDNIDCKSFEDTLDSIDIICNIVEQYVIG